MLLVLLLKWQPYLYKEHILSFNMERLNLTKKDRTRLFSINGVSLKKTAFLLRINYSTLKKYKNGQRLIPINLVKELCGLNKISLKSFNYKIYKNNWGASKGGKKGIKSLYAKYYKELQEWRRKGAYKVYKNNFGKRCILKKIKIPRLSKNLSEFIGIVLGDGTLTYDFVRISADTRFEKPYFNYINSLVYKLFGIKGKMTEKKNNLYLTISSRKLSSLLNKKFELPYGDKIRNEAKIPHIILKSNGLIRSCLRGLVDTDGCIGKSGTNLKLSFSSNNPLLLNQVTKVNKKLSFFNKNYGNNLETCSIEKIKKYIDLIGTANLKHIIRFNERIKEGKLLYNRDLPIYYQRYNNIDIPFHGPVV